MSTNYIHEISPDNGVNVFQIKDAEAAPISLLDDTVGWVGKNELKIPSSVVSSGIYTVNRNSDGEVTSIVANGTPSTQANLLLSSSVTLDKPMILNGCPVGGSDDDYFIYIKNSSSVYFKDYGSGVYLDAGTYTELTIVTRANIAMSNISFMPMFRDAKITDSTFEPYHKPVSDVITDIYGVMGENGAKNRLTPDFNAPSGSVTATVTNNNGVLNINGTQSAADNYMIKSRTNTGNYIYLPKGSYTFSCEGCSNVIVGTTYNSAYSKWGEGETVTFTIDENTNSDYKQADGSVLVGLWITIGAKTYNNEKWKPIIRDARDTNPDFEPYAMTNRELTERFTTISLTTDASETDNEVNLPSGFTYSNTMVMSFMVKDTATNWRYGEGVLVTSERLIIMVKPNNKLDVSCISSEFKGKDMKITLMKY